GAALLGFALGGVRTLAARLVFAARLRRLLALGRSGSARFGRLTLLVVALGFLGLRLPLALVGGRLLLGAGLRLRLTLAIVGGLLRSRLRLALVLALAGLLFRFGVGFAVAAIAWLLARLLLWLAGGLVLRPLG